eukprot:6472854-Amphidinium_carterae.1
MRPYPPQEAAALLDTRLREVMIDYSSLVLLDEAVTRMLGVPRKMRRDVLPLMWKNVVMYMSVTEFA